MLKSTEATIRVYFREGTLKGRKINGRWRVSEENLNRFINGEPIDPQKE
jgi:predicted site-specific integrase-resolvase